MAIAAVCAAAYMIFTLMPVPVRERDSVLGVAALAYFTGVHSVRGPSLGRFLGGGFFGKSPVLRKELLVGLLFTCACVLPVFSRAVAHGSQVFWPLSAATAFYALLAWLNCHAIDRWESEPAPGDSRISTPASALAVAGLLFACTLPTRFAALVAVGAASALLLALLDRFRGRLTPLALRAAADLVLLTPLALLVR